MQLTTIQDDAKLLQAITTALDKKSSSSGVEIVPTSPLIDPTLAKGLNWYDKTRPDYINPLEPSRTRWVVVLFVNRYDKKMLVVRCSSNPRFFDLPGGTPYVFESDINAAKRLFQMQTRLFVKEIKLTQLNTIYLRQNFYVTPFLIFQCNGGEKVSLNMHEKWIACEHLKTFYHPSLKAAYQQLHHQLLDHLY